MRIRLLTLMGLLLFGVTSAYGQNTLQTLGVLPKTPGKKAAATASATGKKLSPAHDRLIRKWIVRSVQRDGKPNAAQIGQKIGDVITIRKDGQNLALG